MIFLNVRIGRNIEEMVADWAVQFWNRYGIRFFMGLFWLVVDISRIVLEAIERLMYNVDEWLRFRSGETALALWLKAGLGAIWFFVAYILRFCVTLVDRAADQSHQALSSRYRIAQAPGASYSALGLDS